MTVWHNELAEAISLDGEWQFTLGDQAGEIRVPGCWEAQGYARRVEGPAIYSKTVRVPDDWHGKPIQLQFGAVSYHAEVEVNGAPVGTHSGSWSPFAVDASEAIRPGQDNLIKLTVFKPGERFPVRESLAGFLPDVALMFGGIWQPARLVAFPGPALSHIAVLCDAQSGAVDVSALALRATGLTATVQVYAPDGSRAAQWQGVLEEEHLRATLAVENPLLWGPGHPALYTVEILLADEEGTQAQVRRRCGFRALTHDGEQLLFNGEPVCLRGVLNWGWYPDVLCPAPDEATIRDEFRRVREMGFNLVKLCLYVPAPRYFEIADEEGVLLWLEFPLWLPEVTPRLRQQAPPEYADILGSVQHHPSVIVYSLGCELSRAVDGELLSQLDRIVREGTRGVLVCDNSGSGEAYGGLTFDFADFNDYHFYCDLQFFEPLVDHFRRDWRRPRPWIFGEFCDADDYRDLGEIAAAHGGELPWWLTEWNPLHPQEKVGYPAQQARMQQVDVGLDDQALQQISRKQSFIVRKTILEKVRARSGMGGYVVTGIRDTPLATSAVFDDLGRSKYPPEAFAAFNADSVLALGRGRAREWTHGGDRPAPFEPYNILAGEATGFDVILSHAGAPLPGGRLAWTVSDSSGQSYARGRWQVAGPLQGGRPQAVGRITFAAPQTTAAETHRLAISLECENGVRIANSWPLWVFPAVRAWPDIGVYDPTGSLAGLDDLLAQAKRVDGEVRDVAVLLTSALDEPVIAYLRGGGSVLLLQAAGGPLPALAQPFWRESIKIIGDHPALNAMPHEGFVDLQFYGLATDWALQTDRLADALPDVKETRGLLRRLDARQFRLSDYLVEARMGEGRFMASTLRFAGGLGDQPAGLHAHLAGRWLLYHLLTTILEKA